MVLEAGVGGGVVWKGYLSEGNNHCKSHCVKLEKIICLHDT